MRLTYNNISMSLEKLIQTRVPAEVAERVEQIAASEGLAVATWLRRLVNKEVNSMHIEAWIAEKSTPVNTNGPASYYLKRAKDISPAEIEFVLLHGPDPLHGHPGARVTPDYLTDMGWYKHVDSCDFVLAGSNKRWSVVRTVYDSASSEVLIVLSCQHFVQERTDESFLEQLSLAERFIKDIEEGNHNESPDSIEFTRQLYMRALATEAVNTITPLPNFNRFSQIITKLEELGSGQGPTAKEILDIEFSKKNRSS